jgi:hypothetical protein
MNNEQWAMYNYQTRPEYIRSLRIIPFLNPALWMVNQVITILLENNVMIYIKKE